MGHGLWFVRFRSSLVRSPWPKHVRPTPPLVLPKGLSLSSLPSLSSPLCSSTGFSQHAMPITSTTSMIPQTFSHTSLPVTPFVIALTTTPLSLNLSLYQPPPLLTTLKSRTLPCFCNPSLPMSSAKSSNYIPLSSISRLGQITSISKACFPYPTHLLVDMTPPISTVTSHLTKCALPSPTGTLLLSSIKLRDITDPDVRFAFVLRAIRFVSFHPWGSLRADADRRKSSVHRIVRALWSSDLQPFQIKKFTAGGGVLWSPAIFNPNKPLRVGNQCFHSTLQPDDHFCWLASRIPPFSKNPQQGAGSPIGLTIDLTNRLRAVMSSDAPADPLQILYDCRFLLRIDPSQMPTYVNSALQKHDKTASIKVLPFTQYYWPKVVLQRESHPDQILAVLQENATAGAMGSPSWISIQWVRPLDAA